MRTAYVYDANGNVTGVALGTGAASRAESASNFIDSRFPGTLTNAKSHSETLTYDARFGLAETLTDANGRTTTLKYDAFGREKRRETPDGAVIETFRERCSSMTCAVVSTGTASVRPVMRIRRTSTAGPTTWRYLDKLGRTIRTETEGFAENARIRRDTRYDARGRVRLSSQPYYKTGGTAYYHKYAYDARGRVTREDLPDGGFTVMAYAVDDMNRNRIKATATETMHKPGGTGASTFAATRKTVSRYNVMGELVERVEGANATAAADKATVMIAYNGAGQPTTHAATGSATTFRHDSAGFRDRVSSPNFGTVDFEYTEFGELSSRKDGKGTTTWTRDALGRPTKRKDPDGVAQWFHDPANARGALARRCHHESATAVSCDGLAAPDFKETLAYNSGARVREATTRINAGSLARTYARGYRTILEKRTAMDAHGNVTGVTYGNGVKTTRGFDPKTGRPTDIDTVSGGGTKIQDSAYAWRSDGLLESRASHVGGNNAKREEFARDPLGRLTTATTKLGNSATATRTLSQTYHANGNLKTRASSVEADIDVTAYAYDASKPHRMTGATIGGRSHKFVHDADGNITKYDCTAKTGCGDDRHIEWNGRNLPKRITVGDSKADATPAARDEFAYGPDGARYHRKTTYMDGETLRTEHTYHVGPFEELLPRSGAAHASIRQTRVADAVRHMKTTTVGTDDDGKETTTTAKYVDYIHKDHLGSVEGVTGADGARTRTLAHDPFGGRRKSDWTAALTPAEISALAGSSDPRESGHAGHEHLDRTGLIHRTSEAPAPPSTSGQRQ